MQNSSIKKSIASHYDNKVSEGQDDLNTRITDGLIIHHHEGWASQDDLAIAQQKKQDQEWIESFIYEKENQLVNDLSVKLDPPINSDDIVYDAGCGEGGASIMLVQKYGCRVIGVSISEKQIETAVNSAQKLGLSNKAQFSQGDMLNSGLDNNMFSVIWVLGSAEHVTDLDQMLSEYRGLATKNSQIMIYTWTKNAQHAKSDFYANQVNDWYQTKLHDIAEFKHSLERNRWELKLHKEYTEQAARYWQIRSLLDRGSGSEKFMDPGFSLGALNYHLLVAKGK